MLPSARPSACKTDLFGHQLYCSLAKASMWLDAWISGHSKLFWSRLHALLRSCEPHRGETSIFLASREPGRKEVYARGSPAQRTLPATKHTELHFGTLAGLDATIQSRSILHVGVNFNSAKQWFSIFHWIYQILSGQLTLISSLDPPLISYKLWFEFFGRMIKLSKKK
jgi:hypothetical protein